MVRVVGNSVFLQGDIEGDIVERDLALCLDLIPFENYSHIIVDISKAKYISTGCLKLICGFVWDVTVVDIHVSIVCNERNEWQTTLSNILMKMDNDRIGVVKI